MKKNEKRENSSFKPIFVFSSRIHVIYWFYFGYCVKSMCFGGVFISISVISGCVFNKIAIIVKILSSVSGFYGDCFFARVRVYFVVDGCLYIIGYFV